MNVCEVKMSAIEPKRAARRTSRAGHKRRSMALTAAYLPAKEGGYTAEILEAVGVYSQGDTFEEARQNLYDAVALMLEEAPQQFAKKPSAPPPGALLEKLFVLVQR